ncbi:MAG TPA: hypothetical protein VGB31_06870 [Myxococcota bacterium]
MTNLVRFSALTVLMYCSLIPVPANPETLEEPARLPGATAVASEQEQRAQSDQLDRAVQREIERQDYTRALALLGEYLDFTRSAVHRPERVFWVIEQVGRIYLSERRDPDGALAFFTEIRKDARLSDLDRSAIDEWISVATEWKEARRDTASGVRDPAHLLDRGTRYYKSGSEKLEVTGVVALANADFDIAASYLLRFAILYNQHSRIGDVLYMLGGIRHYSHSDQEYWSDNYYLKEAIRRFPHTELAERSYKLLWSDAAGAYAQNGIPADLAERLRLYEQLALPAAPISPQAP